MSIGDSAVGLPITVINEDIYDEPPTLVIGTIDNFATLAWRPQARTLFGVDDHGARQTSPPGLIIQDELHLISGPLGTLVALYETAVDRLSTWEVDGKRVRPKVVAATATIRRAAQQVQALFMRQVNVFPPQGLDVADNFFAHQRETESLFTRPSTIHGWLRSARPSASNGAPGVSESAGSLRSETKSAKSL